MPRVTCAMPELAEVEWYRKRWDPGSGDVVVDVSLHPKKYVFRGTNTDSLRENLVGQKPIKSTRRGKQMLFQYSGDNWLGIHLGMTGKTHVEGTGFRPGKYDHLVIYQPSRALVFTDPRQLGHVRFHHGLKEPIWWKRAAPEIDSREFDQKFFEGFLDRHRKAPIKAVLLLQNGFPGIGNWMADEILWRAKILPSKRVEKLTARERVRILHTSKFVVKRSLETLGKDFSDPPRNWLIHQKWKRGGVCPLHRIPLHHATIGGRTTAWCRRCQK
ncbi:MAG: DNA-formamidopyrimidine glycosylase family protein [Verrucomicrobiota bacterium]